MDDDVRNIQWATYTQTALEPLTLVIVLAACILVFALPRRLAVLPMVVVAVLVPYPQRLMLGPIGFDMMRLVLISAVLRLASRGEFSSLQLNRLDKAFLAWAAVMFLLPLLIDPGGIVRQFGFAIDNALEYVVLRCLILDDKDVKPVAQGLVLLSIIVCLGMLVERKTMKNWFYLLGATSGVIMREGSIRATAGFNHPILAGTFGAILFPLAWMLWSSERRDKVLAIIGMGTGLLITLASKSSGPLYAFLSGLFAIGLWRFRQHIGKVRNALWIALILAQLLMDAPVYALLFRVPNALGLVSGSTSYHRYELIDLALHHFWEWCLVGVSLEQVAHWAWGINDVTNQFLAVAFDSGIVGLCLYVTILVRGFSMTGRIAKRTFPADANPQLARYGWGLGCVLLVHVMSFFGVSYFSGFWFFLSLTFALVSACDSTAELTIAAAEGPGAEPICMEGVAI